MHRIKEEQLCAGLVGPFRISECQTLTCQTCLLVSVHALLSQVKDFQSVARSALCGQTKKDQVNSLQLVVAIMLKKRLDKTEQCSDWEATRPLRQSQTYYAALDAAVPRYLLLEARFLPMIFTPSSDHTHGCSHTRRGTRHVDTPSSWNLQRTDLSRNSPYKAGLADWQGNSFSILDADETNQPRRARKRDKKKIGRESRLQTTSIPLRTLASILEALPPADIHTGKTRDSCAEAVLGDAIVKNCIAADFALRFNRRGGIVDMSNCWLLLFINFSGHTKEWKYRNQLSDHGHQINLPVNILHGFKENDLPFLFDVGCLDDSQECIPKIQ